MGLPKNINSVMLDDDSDFFIYLGHDDLLPSNHMEIMLTEFEESTVAVHCNSMAIDSDGNELMFTRVDNEQIRKTHDLIYQLSIDNFISIVGMMHRTKLSKESKDGIHRMICTVSGCTTLKLPI